MTLLKGLKQEYKTGLLLEHRTLSGIFKKADDPLRCFASCVLHDEKDKDDTNKNLAVKETALTLSESEKKLVFDYFKLVRYF